MVGRKGTMPVAIVLPDWRGFAVTQISRRRLLLLAGTALAAGVGARGGRVLAQQPAVAPEMRFFRIGTGGLGGVYYPVGGVLALAISNPPGSRPCDKGGSCGVPGVVAVAQSSHGSVANVQAIAAGTPEAESPVLDWSFWAWSL